MGQENCKNTPYEGMGYKTMKTMESMGSTGIYKNENTESIVFSSILLSTISRKHGKKAWEDSMGKNGKAWNLCK